MNFFDDFHIKNCSDTDFLEVKKYIQLFDLDDRQLKQNEFVTACNQNYLLGFGRVREHKTCSELCSLGIIESERLKGLGKQLMLAMIEKAEQVMYLVCIIPHYFEPLGFTICNDYPIEIKDKLDYCVGSLPVEEKYVVMRRLK